MHLLGNTYTLINLSESEDVLFDSNFESMGKNELEEKLCLDFNVEEPSQIDGIHPPIIAICVDPHLYAAAKFNGDPNISHPMVMYQVPLLKLY